VPVDRLGYHTANADDPAEITAVVEDLDEVEHGVRRARRVAQASRL
jgi:hypothetical protein